MEGLEQRLHSCPPVTICRPVLRIRWWAWLLPPSAAGSLGHSILFETPPSKMAPPGTPALDEAPAKLPEMASSEESGVWTQDLSVHEDAAVGSESQIRGAGHHEGTQLRHGILGD